MIKNALKSENLSFIMSALFFILAFFTILVLFLSGHFEIFAHLFRLTTKNNGVYFLIGLFAIILSFLLCSYNSVYHFRRMHFLRSGLFISLAIFAIIFLCMEFFIERRVFDPFKLEDIVAFEKEKIQINEKSAVMLLSDYFIFIFFMALPLFTLLSNFKFSDNKITRIIVILMPNLNTMIAAFFGFAVFNYVPTTALGYIDLISLLTIFFGYVMLIFLHHKLFSFSDVLNLFLVIFLIISSIFANYQFVDSQSYFEVRKAFYFITFLCWCAGIMQNADKKSKEQSLI